MDQVFQDNLPYMISGLIVGLIFTFVPGQTRSARRLSRTICALSVLYPAVIVLLYLRRNNLGESYAYLLYGLLFGILFGIIAGILFVAWLIVFIRGILDRKTSDCPCCLTCGYNLTGNVSGVCPECGEKIGNK